MDNTLSSSSPLKRKLKFERNSGTAAKRIKLSPKLSNISTLNRSNSKIDLHRVRSRSASILRLKCIKCRSESVDAPSSSSVSFRARRMPEFPPPSVILPISQPTSALSISLESDKRALKRLEFNQQIKKKQEEEQQKREQERLAKEEDARREEEEFRKSCMFRASMIKKYSTINILKSSKQLTVPKEPKLKTKVRAESRTLKENSTESKVD
jgi:hypothetical protein